MVDLGWHTPVLAGGEDRGLNDSGIESFSESHHLAKETCQNIIDAHDSSSGGVATVEFELLCLNQEDFPDDEGFFRVFESCRDYERQAKKKKKVDDFFARGATLLMHDSLKVLRIRDSNTVGLSGDDTDRESRWYRLVRGQGRANVEGVGGGTFGIGQRAPFAFSAIRTIFYSSLSEGSHRFMGKYILGTHEADEVRYQNVGFYGIRREDDRQPFASITDPSAIPPFFRRDAQGTDLYVMGFEDPDWKESIRRSLLSFFYASISDGQLKAVIKEGSHTEEIGAENIEKAFLDEIHQGSARAPEKRILESAYFSLLALRNPAGGAPISSHVGRFGQVKLFVYKSPQEEGGPQLRSRCAYMRRPRMQVFDKKFTRPYDYQAVLLVDEVVGNGYALQLEDPSHSKPWSGDVPSEWDSRQKKAARASIADLHHFVRDGLSSLYDEPVGETEDLPDLAELLPAEDEEDDFWAGPGTEETGESTRQETGAVMATPSEPTVVEMVRKPSAGRVATPVEGGGDAGGNAGAGGSDGVSGDGPPAGGGSGVGPGTGSLGGDDSSEVGFRPGNHTFRSWRNVDDGTYRVSLTALTEDIRGNLKLVAVGDTGTEDLQIRSAVNCETGEVLDCRMATIAGLHLPQGSRLMIDIDLDLDVPATIASRGG